MIDENYIRIQKEAIKCGHILKRFKREWFEVGIELFTRPTLGYKELTDEFIIQVPLMINSKAQYMPFIYGELPVEPKT